MLRLDFKTVCARVKKLKPHIEISHNSRLEHSEIIGLSYRAKKDDCTMTGPSTLACRMWMAGTRVVDTLLATLPGSDPNCSTRRVFTLSTTRWKCLMRSLLNMACIMKMVRIMSP